VAVREHHVVRLEVAVDEPGPVRVGEGVGDFAEDADLRRHLGRKDLDHHLAPERGLLGEEDAAHAAATEHTLDPVGTAERCREAGLEVCQGGSLEVRVRRAPRRIYITRPRRA
jgi:hypothetical protein